MAFYRQFEATIGKKNMMLASTTYGVGREKTSLSPDENEGILIATSFVDTLPTDVGQDLRRQVPEIFVGKNEYVGEYGEYGYRGIMLWAEAVKKAGSPMPDDVIDALGGVKFNGGGGLYTIDGQTNHTVMDIHIVEGQRRAQLRRDQVVPATAAARHPGGLRPAQEPERHEAVRADDCSLARSSGFAPVPERGRAAKYGGRRSLAFPETTAGAETSSWRRRRARVAAASCVLVSAEPASWIWSRRRLPRHLLHALSS